MKRISVTNSSFENFITSNALYVDKTKYIYEMISDIGGYYFFARPRRFGKTLTVSTLENIFKGKKELFKDLYIGKTDYDFKEYPVLHFDFGNLQSTTNEELKTDLCDLILEVASDYKILLDKTLSYSLLLKSLIKELSKKEKVVVLIDEYDKLLSSNVYNPEIENIRATLKGFFEVLKASYDNIRFVFITGVTKYTNMSMFSSMNNLVDISMDETFAPLCGYTQKELEENFKDYIENGIIKTGKTHKEYLQKLKNTYDGYCFCPNTERLYNPISISTFFFKGGSKFENYWIRTGRTTLLSTIGRKVKFNIDDSLLAPIGESALSAFDIVEMAKTNISLDSYKALLFQSGYLTIKDFKNIDDCYSIYLDYPNGEVKEAFSTMLANSVYSGSENTNAFSSTRLIDPLINGDVKGFIEALKSVYASIPYILENGTPNREADFHLMFHAMMKACGADINSELQTNKGRIDSVLKLKQHIYIIEFKIDKNVNDAFSQIINSGYAEAYKSFTTTHTVHLIGISFSSAERNIVDFKEETL